MQLKMLRPKPRTFWQLYQNLPSSPNWLPTFSYFPLIFQSFYIPFLLWCNRGRWLPLWRDWWSGGPSCPALFPLSAAHRRGWGKYQRVRWGAGCWSSSWTQLVGESEPSTVAILARTTAGALPVYLAVCFGSLQIWNSQHSSTEIIQNK